MEACFGAYADLHWFNLNKSANRSGKPLLGLFPRMAIAIGSVPPEDFARFVAAILSPVPDAAILRLLEGGSEGGAGSSTSTSTSQKTGGRRKPSGKLRGMGLELFSRLAFAYRRDLYFVIPRAWGESSGCLKYVGDDFRKYAAMCRNLRAVCDDLGFPAGIRASLVKHSWSSRSRRRPCSEALHKAIGSSLARYSTLGPDEAYVPRGEDDDVALPMEFAARGIRTRRGEESLRTAFLQAGGDRCASRAGACTTSSRSRPSCRTRPRAAPGRSPRCSCAAISTPCGT